MRNQENYIRLFYNTIGEKYFKILKVNGHFLNFSASSWPFPEMNAFNMRLKQIKIQGSTLGSPTEIEEILSFVTEKKIKPWIDTYLMSEVNQAMKYFRAGNAIFKFVLEI